MCLNTYYNFIFTVCYYKPYVVLSEVLFETFELWRALIRDWSSDVIMSDLNRKIIKEEIHDIKYVITISNTRQISVV